MVSGDANAWMTLFRIGSSRYPANDGRGASLYGGRWNRKGTAVIYTAESRALCALEVMANAAELANDYVVTEIDIPQETEIRSVSLDELPAGWDDPEPTDLTRNLGTNWARDLSTAILQVPSAVIHRESNYILNPAHASFGTFRFSGPERFYFEERFRRAWRGRK